MDVPMVMAPIWAGLRCPTIAISTMPRSGTVIFVIMLGMARPTMRRLMEDVTLGNVEHFFVFSIGDESNDVAVGEVPSGVSQLAVEGGIATGSHFSVGIDWCTPNWRDYLAEDVVLRIVGNFA